MLHGKGRLSSLHVLVSMETSPSWTAMSTACCVQEEGIVRWPVRRLRAWSGVAASLLIDAANLNGSGLRPKIPSVGSVEELSPADDMCWCVHPNMSDCTNTGSHAINTKPSEINDDGPFRARGQEILEEFHINQLIFTEKNTFQTFLLNAPNSFL
jgi:hypothetical protein